MIQTSAGVGLTPLVSAPVPAAPVPDVPDVRVGSYYHAKQLRAQIQQLLGGLERVGDRLETLLATAREKAIHRMLEAPTGGYFEDFSSFALCPPPWGLGLTEGVVEALVREARDPARRARLMLASDVVVGRPGVRADRAPAAGAGRRLAAGERGAQYKLARLKRDFPEVLARLARGELPSLKAAWAAANPEGLRLHVLVDPMNVARLVVTRFDAAQQRELVDLLQHPEQITAPPHGRASAAWRAFDAARTTPEERAQHEAERAARRVATRAAIDARKREQRRVAREARQAQAAALGLPSLAWPAQGAPG